MTTMTYVQAINKALKEEMRREPKTIIFGEDVAQHGGIFQATQGIYDEFGPDRIKNTPISETAIAGAAVGAAIGGYRPIAEIMYADFLLVAFTEIFHVAAKYRYTMGPQFEIPMVIRTAMGSSYGAGAEHSNCNESLFMHAPGLKIVTPSTPKDAYGLLKASIRDNNPVLFYEHKQLYKEKGEVPDDEDFIIDIGKADIKKEGKDVTIIANALMVKRSLEAAKELEKEGISAEVLDLRTLAPLDKETIYNSVAKTHRVITVEESNLTAGWGAEVAALIQEDLYDELDAPIVRVASLDVPLPYNINLEKLVIPNKDNIIKAIKSLF